MDFQIIPRRTGVYIQVYNSEGFSELKLPNERFPLEYFKAVFDETPQTKLKINCLAAMLVYDSVTFYPLHLAEIEYLLLMKGSHLLSFILDRAAYLRFCTTIKEVSDDEIYHAAECNYLKFMEMAIHLVPQRTKNAALGYAANWGNLETVKVLVENGAEVKSFGGSALRFAQENGQRDTVEHLLSCGA